MSEQLSSHVHLGGQGPVLHFSHANGFHPLAYRALLEPLLDEHEVIASLHRPLWQPAPEPLSLNSWQPFADDLLRLLERFDHPVVSVGHSMGSAAILLAAAQRPELFKALVIIEPVLVPRRYLYLLRWFGRFAKRKIPLVRRTLDRVDCWSDKQAAFEHFRPKAVFKHIGDAVLWDYVEHGIREDGRGQFELSYSKAWEAHCYTLVHDLWPILPRIDVPVLAIRGGNSNTLSLPSWNRWRQISPQHDYLEIEQAGHLVPFERPDRIATEIRDWLAQR
jgi:pimeloyl-ACP methyl ester carboxylesterase